jgi:3-oxoacyl-[acyl-carrier protein] reductase
VIYCSEKFAKKMDGCTLDLGLKNKVAIVTGGSSGIGKAASIAMAKEGAIVVICARNSRRLLSAASEIEANTRMQVTSVQADVTKPSDIKNLFSTTLSKYGRIDILVNNAGVSSTGNFEKVNDSKWQDDLDLKLMAAIRCARIAIPHMKTNGGGRIVNVTSHHGKTPGAKSMPTSVSRAAGIALTKALSKEYAPDDILINTVCVGIVKAGQYEGGTRQLEAEERGLNLNEMYEEMASANEIPLGRIGETHEAGDVIAFLCSERASYITGTSINVDGGSAAVV